MREVILGFSLITGMACSTLAHEGNVDGFGYRYFHISNMNTGVINPDITRTSSTSVTRPFTNSEGLS